MKAYLNILKDAREIQEIIEEINLLGNKVIFLTEGDELIYASQDEEEIPAEAETLETYEGYSEEEVKNATLIVRTKWQKAYNEKKKWDICNKETMLSVLMKQRSLPNAKEQIFEDKVTKAINVLKEGCAKHTECRGDNDFTDDKICLGCEFNQDDYNNVKRVINNH